MVTQPELLPDRAVLVHIGPYKTGTTAIQTSLNESRGELGAHAVTYPGDYHRQMRPSWALLGRSRVGEPAVPEREWDAMVAEVRAAQGRVVISSEDFASARRHHAQRLVDELGPDRVHVLIVARRLDKLLPSAWQERVKSVNETRTYDAWLREVLSVERAGDAARIFWHNHGLKTLVERWRAVLPADRVLVLVNDEDDRRLQAATFEQLLGLPDGALTPGPQANTSLSMERIELCRQVNLAVEARGWVGSRTLNTPRRAMLAGLRSAPLQDFESPIPALPSWTGPRLVELSDERARTVAGSGVRVLGDPDLLRYTPDPDAPDLSEPPSVLPTQAAANAIEHALAGMLRREGRQERRARPRAAAAASPSPPVDPLTRLTSRAMLREVARRQRARLRRGGTGGRTGRGDPRDRSDL
jgi:hypothetical protein